MVSLSKSADAESSRHSFYGTEFNKVHHAEMILSTDQLHSFEHRQNYQLLKKAYTKLQDAHSELESEMVAKVKELKDVKEKHSLAIADAKQAINLLNTEYEKAAKNELTQERLELIRIQISSDIEDYYRMQISQAHDSVTKALSETIRLQQEVNQLKSQIEGERNESKVIIEKNRLLYEKELTSLRSLKDEMESRLANVSSFKLNNEIEVCQETSATVAKITVLTNELENAKSEIHTSKIKLNNTIKTMVKENADLKAKNHEADIERDSLKRQLRFIKGEFNKLRDELETERQQLLETSRQAGDKEVQLQRISQRARIELANLRSDAQQQQAKIEAQRDELIANSQALQSELDILTTKCKHVEATAGVRELQVEEKLARSHEQAFADVSRLENEVEQLRSELAEAREATKHVEAAKRATEERLTQAIAHTVKVQTDSEQMFTELNLLRLKQLEAAYLPPASCTHATAAPHANSTGALSDVSPKETQERNWARRERELHEEILQKVQKRYQAHLESVKKKKQMACERLKQVKCNLHALAIENTRLKMENAMLSSNVPRQEYERVLNRLSDLRQRHDEYKEILLCSTNSLPITERSLQQT